MVTDSGIKFDEFNIWTPALGDSQNYTISIDLNPKFAQHALGIKPDQKSIERLFSVVRRGNPDLLRNTPSNMYDFIDDTACLKCIYFDAGNGVWLSSDVFTVERIKNHDTSILFSGHNISFGSERTALQFLFQYWVLWVQAIS